MFDTTPKDNLELAGQNFYYDEIVTSIINPVTVRKMYKNNCNKDHAISMRGNFFNAMVDLMLIDFNHKMMDKYKKKMGR